jgi:hypothetical protein
VVGNIYRSITFILESVIAHSIEHRVKYSSCLLHFLRIAHLSNLSLFAPDFCILFGNNNCLQKYK